jgi:hypothetical protein
VAHANRTLHPCYIDTFILGYIDAFILDYIAETSLTGLDSARLRVQWRAMSLTSPPIYRVSPDFTRSGTGDVAGSSESGTLAAQGRWQKRWLDPEMQSVQGGPCEGDANGYCLTGGRD